MSFSTKMFTKFLTWAFWGQDLGPGWVKKAYYKTRNTRTRNYGTWNNGRTTEHWQKTRMLVEHQNNDRKTKCWRNTETLAEQQNSAGTIGIPRNSVSWEEQQNNKITKQHQEILPIQNNNILSRWHNSS